MRDWMRMLGRLAAVVAVALLLVGLGAEATSAKDSKPRKVNDSGSEAAFKAECEIMDGEFFKVGSGPVSSCLWSNGGDTLCKNDGNDCTYTPPPPKRVTSGGARSPFVGTGGKATAGTGSRIAMMSGSADFQPAADDTMAAVPALFLGIEAPSPDEAAAAPDTILPVAAPAEAAGSAEPVADELVTLPVVGSPGDAPVVDLPVTTLPVEVPEEQPVIEVPVTTLPVEPPAGEPVVVDLPVTTLPVETAEEHPIIEVPVTTLPVEEPQGQP